MDRWAFVLVLLRGCHLLALASLFGALVSLALVAPAALSDAGAPEAPTRKRLVRLAKWSAGAALLTGVLWTILQAAAMASATSFSETLSATTMVLRGTRFGHLVLIRVGLLLAVIPLLAGRGSPLAAALTLAGGALAMQGGTGHAGATSGMMGTSLLIFEALHLLAAGAWLGGLVPLFMLVGSLPPQQASVASHYFSVVGLTAVLLIAGTAIVQSWQWIGSLGGLFGTRYGEIALLKLGLFLGLLTLAAINRFALTERLRVSGDNGSRRLLQVSIAAEAILGGLVILVAAFLASSTPATHETPIWPFAWRPSLDALYDPYRRGQILVVSLFVALAAAAAVVAFLKFRAGWLSLGPFAAILPLAGPTLASLFTVNAYPTTFAVSPTEFADSSIVRGAHLYAVNCSACHGADARGDGPAAKSLPAPPADLTAAHFWMHTEGDLFWFISHGIQTESGAVSMPAFGDALGSDDRWALIDFLKAHNAGENVRATGHWNPPAPLPQFDAVCANGSAIDLDDLHGRVLHIVTDPEGLLPPPAAVGGFDIVTIVLSRDRKMKPVGTECVTVDAAAYKAFSILFGVTPEALTETQALADQNGWLRSRWRPGDSGDWNDPRTLQAVIRDIVTHPLSAAAEGGHGHHH